MALGAARPTFRCDGCGRRRTGDVTTTVTSRRLCAPCADLLAGAVAGVVAHQGDDGASTGAAIATAGWFAAWRARRRRGRAGGG